MSSRSPLALRTSEHDAGGNGDRVDQSSVLTRGGKRHLNLNLNVGLRAQPPRKRSSMLSTVASSTSNMTLRCICSAKAAS